MGINATEDGTPIYLKDNAWANKFFSLDLKHAPKNKFNFICALWPKRHLMNPALFANVEDFFHLVKTAEPPKPNFDTEIVDQYNKRRIIQKKITWDPVTITFHDDMDSQIYHVLMDYMSYNYKEFSNDSKRDWTLDTVTNLINDVDWGLRTNLDKYYFDTIDIIWMASGRGTQIVMENPVITNIQFDQLDFSDGTTPLEISITLEYEGVRIGSINSDLDTATRLNDLAMAKKLMGDVNEIGKPFDDERFEPGASLPGKDRSIGLGELFAAGATFYGKHNNKPTIKNLVDDLLLRPSQGVLSSSINSWGNFNFGGIGNATAQSNNIGNVIGNQVGDIFKVANSGSIIQDVFKFGSGGFSGG